MTAGILEGEGLLREVDADEHPDNPAQHSDEHSDRHADEHLDNHLRRPRRRHGRRRHSHANSDADPHAHEDGNSDLDANADAEWSGPRRLTVRSRSAPLGTRTSRAWGDKRHVTSGSYAPRFGERPENRSSIIEQDAPPLHRNSCGSPRLTLGARMMTATGIGIGPQGKSIEFMGVGPS